MLTKLLQKIDLWIISSAANILSLALPIYVIQALSRYLASGIDATLYALTAGVIVSIGAEFLLRQYRRQAVLIILRDESKNSSFFDGLRQINFAHPALANWSNLPSRIQRIRKNRTNHNIDMVLALYDIPFAFLFIAVIYLISPVAFVIFIIFCLMGICFSAIFTASEHRIRSNMIPKQYHMDYAEAELLSPAYAQASLAIQRQWLARYQKNDNELNDEHLRLASNQHNQRLVNMVLSNMLIALTIFSSVILVFKGELEIGALIALNILVAKSFIQLMQFPAIFKLFRIAKNNKELSIISNLANKPSGKSSIKEFSGNVELRQVIFQQSARMGQVASNPISYYFLAGTTTVITGANGVGKTSLYELLCGSHIPQSGVILIDGVDRQQLSFDWWSTQVGCLSQDPQFLNETLYNSFNANGVDEDTMSLAIFHAGLKPLIDNLPSGIHTSFADNKFSSLKIRKQVALAHILSRPSQLILMDEPTAGLDSQTAMIFYNQMNQMIAQKRTLIIFSTDPVVMKGADTVISIGTSQGMLVTKNRRQHEQKDVAIKPDEKKAQPTKKKTKKAKH